MDFPVEALITACGILLSVTWYLSLTTTNKLLSIIKHLDDSIVGEINFSFYLWVRTIISFLCCSMFLLISYATRSSTLLNLSIILSYLNGAYILYTFSIKQLELDWPMRYIAINTIGNMALSLLAFYVLYRYYIDWSVYHTTSNVILIIWYFISVSLLNYCILFNLFPRLMNIIQYVKDGQSAATSAELQNQPSE